MSSSTKEQLGAALKHLLEIKPIEKISVKDIAETCGVNRHTFYYHFDDVYDLLEWSFEEDANRVLPKEIVYSNWRNDVLAFFQYLYDNKKFTLNIFNSPRRSYMLRFFRAHLEKCIRGFAVIVSQNMNIDRADFEFVISFYANGIVGLISQWMDAGMVFPADFTQERLMAILESSVENLLSRFDRT